MVLVTQSLQGASNYGSWNIAMLDALSRREKKIIIIKVSTNGTIEKPKPAK